MTLLIDIGKLDNCCSDHALESIYKAMSEPPEDGIWYPHESPFIRRLIELFTSRGLLRIEDVKSDLKQWLDGRMHQPNTPPTVRPAGLMARWDATELAVARLYLEALPPDAWVLEDYMLLVEWLVQRYLPPGVMRTEAEWFAVRAGLMGKVQAQLNKVDERGADKLLGALPNTLPVAVEQFGLAGAQRAALEYGFAHCAENITALTDSLRHRIKNAIMDYAQARAMGDKETARGSLESRLFDEFAVLNRDWRRIAVTEAGEIANQGMVASMAPGSKLKRVEFYKGACAFCRSIDGKIMNVVDAADQKKNGDTDIWPGKTNIGRSVAPRKRVGSLLVPRKAHEKFWIAAGVQHPHCRGYWEPVEDETEPDVDPAFTAWAEKVLNG